MTQQSKARAGRSTSHTVHQQHSPETAESDEQRRWCQRWSWRPSSGSSVGDVGAAAAVAALVVDDEQDDTQEEADGAHGDVGDAQEGVLAAHPGDCAQDHPLPALEAAHWVVWGVSGSRTRLSGD